MKLLFDLTLRGTLAFAVIALLDLLFAHKITARARRGWWLLVPLAFLLTIPLPVLPLHTVQPLALDHWIPAASMDAAVHASFARFGFGVPGHPVDVAWPVFVISAGAMAYLLVAVLRTRTVLRRWGRERLCTDAVLLETLEDCKAEAGIDAPIGLIVSDAVDTPMILGWLRPRVLLPAGLVSSLSREQLRGVLFHELAHFRALDVPTNWLFTLACALHWFNPAAHLAFRAWTRFCEEAADETAIVWLRQPSGLAYGETLLHVLKNTHGAPPPFAALAIVESVSQLRKRITMIKHYEHKSSHALFAAAVFLIIAMGTLLRPVHAAEPTDDPKAVATGVMQSWLQEIDDGKYEQSWNDAAPSFQKAITAEKWATTSSKVRKPLGQCNARKMASAVRQGSVTGPAGTTLGDFILAQFDTSFENLKYAVETVTFEKAPDGTWKASGYYIKPKV